MKTLPALAVGAIALLNTGVTFAQSGNMMDGGTGGGGLLRRGMAADFAGCRRYRSRRTDRQSRRQMTEDAHRLGIAPPSLFATLLNPPRSLS